MVGIFYVGVYGIIPIYNQEGAPHVETVAEEHILVPGVYGISLQSLSVKSYLKMAQ